MTHERVGLQVFASARQAETLKDLAELGIITLSLDVTSSDSVEEAKDEVSEITNGKLDYLINNAGRNYTVPALDIDFEEVQKTFEANVFGVFRTCQTFAPLLIEARGTVVQIGSVAAIIPYVFSSVYNATKAALHAYSNTLRVELAPFGVKVVTIITGGVQSRIARTDRELPKESFYWPVDEEYQRRVKHSQEGAMSNTDYARSVVRQVFGTTRPRRWIWEGKKSWLIWAAQTFLPLGIFVSRCSPLVYYQHYLVAQHYNSPAY